MTHIWYLGLQQHFSQPKMGLLSIFHVPPINMKVATIKGGETTLIKDHLDQSFNLTNQEFFFFFLKCVMIFASKTSRVEIMAQTHFTIPN